MKYGFQVEIEERTEHGGRRKVWKWVRPTKGNPYRYDTEEEARRAMTLSYPDQVRGFGPFGVRVHPFNDIAG